jgi:hypothetical protein
VTVTSDNRKRETLREFTVALHGAMGTVDSRVTFPTHATRCGGQAPPTLHAAAGKPHPRQAGKPHLPYRPGPG